MSSIFFRCVNIDRMMEVVFMVFMFVRTLTVVVTGVIVAGSSSNALLLQWS